MKYVAAVWGAAFAILLASCAASAQGISSDPMSLGSAGFASASTASASAPLLAQLDAPPALPSFALPSPADPLAAPQKNPPPAGSGSDVPPQGVYGVFPSYRYQIYVGYAFLRFYIIPNVAENMNGLDFSVAYYFKDNLAVDGELAVAVGTYTGQNSEAFLGMGGLRYRHPVGQASVWIHGLVGEAHFSPLTPFGGEDGLGYEAGGGLDFTPRRMRVSWRVEADMVGSHLYGTYQYSPKISLGIVFKD